MTPGSDEWFREESEKAAGPESPLWAPVFEKALRRAWDAACEECSNELKRAFAESETLNLLHGAARCHAKKVSTEL